MDFYLKYVLPKEKLDLEDSKQNDTLVLEKETINVIEEKTNLPRSMPKPINLSLLTKYYGIKWGKNAKQKIKGNF